MQQHDVSVSATVAAVSKVAIRVNMFGMLGCRIVLATKKTVSEMLT